MVDRRSDAGDGLIIQVNGFVMLEDDWDGRGSDAPNWPVISGAASLARLFRDGSIVAPCRVLAGAFGMIGFEWFGSACHLSITVLGADEVEVVSRSNLGRFTSEVLRRGVKPIEGLVAVVRRRTGRIGLRGAELCAV